VPPKLAADYQVASIQILRSIELLSADGLNLDLSQHPMISSPYPSRLAVGFEYSPPILNSHI
jgi:hypothetical protein